VIRRLSELPVLVLLLGLGALAMIVPAAHAAALRDWPVARAFGYSSLLFLTLTSLLAIATAANRPGNAARSQLLTMAAVFALLPLVLAVPFREATPGASLAAAWWEMVSALTTTGATLFDPDALAPSVHLWRALVGWLGGLFTLVAAIAILAPLNLGGFEVLSPSSAQGAMAARLADPVGRIVRAAVSVAPVYAGLTAVLWLGLIIAGDEALVAACHAMSTLSTSGISPVGGPDVAASGVAGEVLVAIFLVPSLSRRLSPGGRRVRLREGVLEDHELRLGAAILLSVSLILFLRHWIAAAGAGEGEAPRALSALWGGFFTALSFLTTTGFQAAGWDAARSWSGLGSPGLILVGLAIIGGGIATTAGGVKLLRMYALLRHGERELQKLVHPNSLGGAGSDARRLRRSGARIASVSFMLFAISIAVVIGLLTAGGTGFEEAIIFGTGALSNTGPLAGLAGDVPLAWSGLSGFEQAVLAVAMVVGRLETLAVIALFSPALWRG
jgi:trk system potassium uptake protein TrkH